MSFVSYAQNFEDVMLWRALKGIEQGFYIDVGANEPTANSVSKMFYDRGWHGINIEPLPQLWADLERERPNDINLQCAAGEFCGETDLWESAIHGWSTADPAVAAMHQQEGVEGVWRKAPLLTLAEICRAHVKGEVHFLKIDVEGHERSVLAGMDFSLVRPWIVVVEATLPNSTVENHQDWEPLLLSKGYFPAYADGLNRFYLAREKEDLQGYFRYPPNVLDDFTLYRQVLAEGHQRDLGTRLCQAEVRAQQAEAAVQELSRALETAQARIGQSEQAAHEAQAQTRAIHASTSWRITRPLRGVMRVLRGDFSPIYIISRALRRRLSSPPIVPGAGDAGPDLSPKTGRMYRMLERAAKQDKESDLTGIEPRAILDLSDLFIGLSGNESSGAESFSEAQFNRAAERILMTLSPPAGEQPFPTLIRQRLAYISPLPPGRSGISDYSAELLPFLSQWYA
ncbi:MAG: FkbM family methyltransferase, partial [Azonexus sp.]|uniref:FkbM family methyltransferase n=1 Tax=Azonexus sp. TaxID=1872668 RepID=UPI00281E25E3